MTTVGALGVFFISEKRFSKRERRTGGGVRGAGRGGEGDMFYKVFKLIVYKRWLGVLLAVCLRSAVFRNAGACLIKTMTVLLWMHSAV